MNMQWREVASTTQGRRAASIPELSVAARVFQPATSLSRIDYRLARNTTALP